MSNMKNVDALLSLYDTVDYSVDVALVAVQQMPKLLSFRLEMAVVWMFA